MLQFPIPSSTPPSLLNKAGVVVKPSINKHCRPRPPKSLLVETSQVESSEGTSPPRRLILLRHAKSSWEDRSLRDHDRPLSKAGQADAIRVSHKLQQLGWIPEIILSSDALRTRQTLKIMQDQVQGFLEAEVHFISSFYSIAALDGQTAEHLQHAICKYSRDEILTVMWVLLTVTASLAFHFIGVWDIIGDGRRQPQRSQVFPLSWKLAMLPCLKLLGNHGKRHFLWQDMAGGSFRMSWNQMLRVSSDNDLKNPTPGLVWAIGIIPFLVDSVSSKWCYPLITSSKEVLLIKERMRLF